MVGNILGGCIFESVLTIWCSSLLEDARAIRKINPASDDYGITGGQVKKMKVVSNIKSATRSPKNLCNVKRLPCTKKAL